MRSPEYGHYVARMRPWSPHIDDQEMFRWLWTHLRESFPDALAVVVMPNHPHIIARLHPNRRRTLASLLGAFARRFELGEIWQHVPDPEPLVDAEKLARNVRYVSLNPCRRWNGRPALGDDPLAWPWCTHRDVMGLVIDPWVDAARLASALGWHSDDAAARLHHYVSSDPDVAVQGTPPPSVCTASDVPIGGLDAILRAACEATRAVAADIRKRSATRTVFLGLARYRGWRNWQTLAAECRMSTNRARDAAERCPQSWLEAAARCLGDPRLVCGEANGLFPAVQLPTSLRAASNGGFSAVRVLTTRETGQSSSEASVLS
jgi:hypothetical protein